MYCLKCGSRLDEKDNFCKNCGTSISDDKYKNQYDYQININKISEEDYIKVYVGNNYEQIKKGKFSISTFFLGVYYTLYRKMWLYSLLWIALLIVINVLEAIYDIKLLILIPFVFRIIIAFNFNKLYLRTVEKRVEKIKQNSSKTDDEKLKECKKKGGVSVLALILSISFVFVVICMALFSVLFKTITDITKKAVTPKLNESSELVYEIPHIFEDKGNTNSAYKGYSYFGNKSSCSISISNYTVYSEKTAEDYLKSEVTINMNDTTSEVLSKTINGTEWKYVEVLSDNSKYYHYATIYNNKIYRIRYNIYRDDDKSCSNGYNIFINSLSFQPTDYGANTI